MSDYLEDRSCRRRKQNAEKLPRETEGLNKERLDDHSHFTLFSEGNSLLGQSASTERQFRQRYSECLQPVIGLCTQCFYSSVEIRYQVRILDQDVSLSRYRS